MSIFTPQQAQKLAKLPGLSEAQVSGLRIQMLRAKTHRDAACVYETIRGYAPANNGNTTVGVMAVYAQTCALIAKMTDLAVAGAEEDPEEVPTAEEIKALEAELAEKRKLYLQAVARTA